MSFIQVPPDSTGKLVDTSVIVASSQHRENVTIADPAAATGIAPVTSSGGLRVSMSSGTVTLSSAIALSSGTVTLSSATSLSSGIVTLSSATSLSSGIVTLSSNPTVVSASSGVVQVLTSGNLIVSVTSGIVTLSSNITVVSASSGLVQISGTVTVNNTSSGTVQVLTSGPIATYPSSGTLNTPFTFSASSSGSLTVPTTSVVRLMGWNVGNQSTQQVSVLLYNSTGPTLGSTTNLILQIPIPGSSVGAGSNMTLGQGVNFSGGLSVMIHDSFVSTSTSVGLHSAGDVLVNLYYI